MKLRVSKNIVFIKKTKYKGLYEYVLNVKKICNNNMFYYIVMSSIECVPFLYNPLEIIFDNVSVIWIV